MTAKQATFKPALILHGGAGNLKRATLPPDLYAAYHASLQTYLRSTHSLLINGSSALDAAVHAVSLMEDDELFNCGRGSVFTTAGTIEMEASVMVTSVQEPDEAREGSVKRGAGVMGVRNVRHPIQLARESLLRTGYTVDGQKSNDGGSMHSQLVGPYVETLASDWGLEFKPDEWFFTQRRWDEHVRGLKGEAEPLSLSQGTVGCVCLDQWGNLAVATSTGGMTNKLPGRIGDTPTLGAGFWAEAWDKMVSDSASFGPTQYPASVGGLIQEARGWLADCLPPFLREPRPPVYTPLPTNAQTGISGTISEKQSPYQVLPSKPQHVRRAIAVSGTGNGDSFLRVAAARTAAAMLRFSAPGRYTTLADAVSAVAGPGGELQRSAGRRWKVTGEGEGGIIGIEAESAPATGSSSGQLRRGRVVSDFNSGGMWRAYIEEDGDGKEKEVIMVFREDYK
jgi:L-asparaginase